MTEKAGNDLRDYQGADLGAPELKGSFATAQNGFDITAGGRDIWEKCDEGFFVFREVRGDFDLACRVETLTSADLYTKAGIMARETLEPDSRFVFLEMFPDNRPRNRNQGGFEFEYRPRAGQDCIAIYPEDPARYPISFPNAWIRLVRKGNSFTASLGRDGVNWSVYTEFPMDLSAATLVGFAVTSHNIDSTVAMRVRDIRFSG